MRCRAFFSRALIIASLTPEPIGSSASGCGSAPSMLAVESALALRAPPPRGARMVEEEVVSGRFGASSAAASALRSRDRGESITAVAFSSSSSSSSEPSWYACPRIACSALMRADCGRAPPAAPAP